MLEYKFIAVPAEIVVFKIYELLELYPKFIPVESGRFSIANKILQFLESDNLTFIITIPIWDTSGRAHMKQIYNNEIEKQNIDYGEFEIINKIKESKYFKGLRMISKENFTYIDHNFKLFKNKTIQNTYVIIISSKKDFDTTLLMKYDFS